MSDPNIILTRSAEERLERAKAEYAAQIVRFLVETRRVPGEPHLELTASDIDLASQELRVSRRSRIDVRRAAVLIYGMTGIVLLFGGFFYQKIADIARDSPTSVMLMLLGAAFSFISALMSALIRPRSAETQLAVSSSVMAEQMRELIRLQAEALKSAENVAPDERNETREKQR